MVFFDSALGHWQSFTLFATRLRSASVLLLAMLILAAVVACGDGEAGSKEDIAGETWDCLAESDPDFEQSMLMTFRTAENLDEAKEQYVSASIYVSLSELEASRDHACGSEGTTASARTTSTPEETSASPLRTPPTPGAGGAPTTTLQTASATAPGDTSRPPETETRVDSGASTTGESQSFSSVSGVSGHTDGCRLR